MESLDNKVEDKQNINKNIISNKINIKDSEQNKNIDKIKFINSNENIKNQLKRNKNQNNNLNKQILNKMGIINNKSDSYKIKQKRIKDNYSYYFKLKEKAKKWANKMNDWKNKRWMLFFFEYDTSMSIIHWNFIVN